MSAFDQLTEGVMRQLLAVATLAGVVAAHGAAGQTSRPETDLGRVVIGKQVIADGKPLAAGAYQVRLTADRPVPRVGQSVDGERWVEFVRSGRVVGRELAVVIRREDGAGVLKGPMPPANQARVDILKGREYLRLWINQAGINYIINLPFAS